MTYGENMVRREMLKNVNRKTKGNLQLRDQGIEMKMTLMCVFME